MTKVFLMVVIAYTNMPTKQYHEEMKNVDECHAREVEIYQDTIVPADNVKKYFIGCSFEDPAEFTPVRW